MFISRKELERIKRDIEMLQVTVKGLGQIYAPVHEGNEKSIRSIKVATIIQKLLVRLGLEIEYHENYGPTVEFRSVPKQ